MPTLRLALAQVNPTVGDLAGNAALVRGWTRKAADAGAQLVRLPGDDADRLPGRGPGLPASPSWPRPGAPCERLAADLAADGLGELAGRRRLPRRRRAAAGQRGRRAGPRRPQRRSRCCTGGEVVATYFKHHLPNYGVFDEDRYFVPGDTLTVVRIGGVDVALTICEDMWQAGGPFAAARRAGVGLVRQHQRLAVRAEQGRRPAAAGPPPGRRGGRDRRVRQHGRRPGRAGLRRRLDDRHAPTASCSPGRRSSSSTCSCTTSTCRPADRRSRPPTIVAGRACGSRTARLGRRPAGAVRPGRHRRRRSQPGRRRGRGVAGAGAGPARLRATRTASASVVLGLSGGIDSAVVAAIAVDALGPDRVVGVSMPSRHSSEHSRDDAADLAKRTGLDYRVEPIQPMVDAFLANLSLSGLAVENLQARVRGVILMALSNQEGHLVLTTGNKSELAVGYSTLYGDSVGGFNPLKDVPKTLVWRLAKWRNRDAERYRFGYFWFRTY